MGGGAADGLRRHQQWSPSWILSSRKKLRKPYCCTSECSTTKCRKKRLLMANHLGLQQTLIIPAELISHTSMQTQTNLKKWSTLSLQRIRIPNNPKFSSGLVFATARVASITAMIEFQIKLFFTIDLLISFSFVDSRFNLLFPLRFLWSQFCAGLVGADNRRRWP